MLAIALPSCKKEEEEDDEKEYLSGTLKLTSVDAFLLQNQEISVTPSGITNDKTGYYFYGTWDTSVKDTTRVPGGAGDGTWTLKVPEELGTYTITCVCYADGYYTSSAKVEFCVVNPELEQSLTDTEWSDCDYSFTDPRDNNLYFVEKVGDKEWMKNNLCYAGSGTSYYFSPAMDRIYGRFYNWEEAMTACPEGWRLPSDADFAEYATSVSKDQTFKAFEEFKGVAGDFMVNCKFTDERMWEYWPQDVTITNKSGFCSISAGYMLDLEDTRRFVGINDYSTHWTSDENGDNGYYRYMYVKNADIHIGQGEKKSFKANVRCVKGE